jgi:hypothetical protein
MPCGGCLRKDEHAAKLEIGEAIQPPDFRQRVLVVTNQAVVLCRVTDGATN